MRKDYQSSDIKELIEKLEEATKLKGKGKVTKRIFKILETNRNIVSWKFNEWDYGKDNIKLPSDARGLFTSDEGPNSKILVRGYDKFFNINEVYFTRWDWLERNTEGPFYVSTKENGCIILISGLKDGTIIVCSKHSTGSREDVNRNHATVGQEFLKTQLSKLGISLKDFALKLYEMNVTAVAEYCNDEFEEHVVEYKGNDAGLYLHGLNLNQPSFQTLSLSKVNSFSKTYGFKPIEFFQKDSIEDLKTTLDEYSKIGSYNGKETEGFVIRCKLNNATNDDYFFKFKFEEPYLMYRQWREVTKSYIQHRRRGDIKLTKHKFITSNYLDFIIPLIENDPQIATDFLNGHGVIELRKKFLNHYGKTGSEILNQELLEELNTLNALDRLKIDDETKFVFIPIATIGCGKTTTALTITQLFSKEWGIVSNDDIPHGKDSKKEFIKRSLKILQDNKAVVLDRNNHQFRERKQIIDDFRELRDEYICYNTNVQFICLNFVKDSHSKDLWLRTTERVFKRGDNHQSIHADTDSKMFIEGIMSGFVKRFQPFEPSKIPDSEFDFVIHLNSSQENSSLTNAKKIIEELNTKYPVLIKSIPSESEIQASFQKALQFKPSFLKYSSKKKQNQQKKKQKPETDQTKIKKSKNKSPVYFSIILNDTESLLNELNSLIETKNFPYQETLLSDLKKNERVQDKFHVTLAHVNQGKKGTKAEKNIWKEYVNYYESKEIKDDFLGVISKIILKFLIWDKKAMTAIVQVLEFKDKNNDSLIPFKINNKFPHITIGTATSETKPFYSNQLAETASKYEKEGVYDDISILKWNQEIILEDLSVVVNY